MHTCTHTHVHAHMCTHTTHIQTQMYLKRFYKEENERNEGRRVEPQALRTLSCVGFSYLFMFARHYLTAGTLLEWTLLSVLRREPALSWQRLPFPPGRSETGGGKSSCRAPHFLLLRTNVCRLFLRERVRAFSKINRLPFSGNNCNFTLVKFTFKPVRKQSY